MSDLTPEHLLEQLNAMVAQPTILPPPASVPVDEDYERAVLHLAFYIESGVFDLVLAVVEFYPNDVTPPSTTQQSHTKLQGGGSARLFCRRVVMSARDAWQWYENLTIRGHFHLYPQKGSEIDFTDEKCKHSVTGFEHEPTWPCFTLTHGSSQVGRLPILPSTWTCPRVHHALRPQNAQLWQSGTRQCLRVEAVEDIRQHLGVNLAEWPELMGSAHFIAPNPILRHVGLSANSSGENSSTAVFVTVEPREGRDFGGLQAIIVESRPTGDTLVASHVFHEQRRLEVQLPHSFECDHTTLWIVSPERGPLYRSGPHTFMRSMSFNMNISSATRVYEVPMADGSIEERTTQLYTPQNTTVGNRNPTAEHARRELSLGAHTRARRELVNQGSQIWFDQERDNAHERLRELIARAQHRVRFTDPYFGSSAFQALIPAIGDLGVSIEVLTAAAFLKDPSKTQGLREEGDVLVHTMDQWSDTSMTQTVEIRVMTGRRPDVHDRFIEIDSEVWLLGSSINEFGSRGTLLLRTQAPEAISEHLDQAFSRARAFHDWLSDRRAERSEEP